MRSSCFAEADEFKWLSINRLNWKLPKYSSVHCSHSLIHLVASGWGRRIILGKLGVGSTASYHRFAWNHLGHTPLWTLPTTYGDLAGWACSHIFFDFGHSSGYCKLCTACEAQVLWVSGWKVSSDACLPAQNSKVSSASPCNCAAVELSCGLWIHSRCSFAVVVYDAWY